MAGSAPGDLTGPTAWRRRPSRRVRRVTTVWRCRASSRPRSRLPGPPGRFPTMWPTG